MTLVESLSVKIEEQLSKGKSEFVVYPYGKIGYIVKKLLIKKYHIQPVAIIDNGKVGKIASVSAIDILDEIEHENLVILMSTDNQKVLRTLLKTLEPYEKCEIVNVLPKKIGKHSWGSIVDDEMYSLESVGSFCSFATGACVVANHNMNSVSTSSVFNGTNLEDDPILDEIAEKLPLEAVADVERTVIGNDVWFGRNVVVCNGAKIGNGVVAAAGAVITQDVPDYAIVGGVPAKIIRYRFTPEQIEQLLKIKWWDWPDEKIAENLMYFKDIDTFIHKFGV